MSSRNLSLQIGTNRKNRSTDFRKNAFSPVCLLNWNLQKMKINRLHKRVVSLRSGYANSFSNWISQEMWIQKLYKKMLPLWCVFLFHSIVNYVKMLISLNEKNLFFDIWENSQSEMPLKDLFYQLSIYIPTH